MASKGVATRTEQVPETAIRCPVCGIPGFKSPHGVVTHVRRLHGKSAWSKLSEQGSGNPTEQATESEKDASKKARAKEPAPAVADITCPACDSEIKSDGRGQFAKSPRLQALERAEMELSDLEPENEKLREENKSLEEQLKASKKTPEGTRAGATRCAEAGKREAL